MPAPEVDSPGTLLLRAADGDQGAWDALVAGHNGLLWSIARGYRLSLADAGDAVQTTWLKLVENLHAITDPDKVGSWLATTIRRECLRLLRRSGREQPQPGDHAAFETADGAPRVDERLLLAERDAELWAAFTELPDRCQCLLRVLIASPRPGYDTVAAALDMPIGSIGPTRARCLARLRTLLEERQPELQRKGGQG